MGQCAPRTSYIFSPEDADVKNNINSASNGIIYRNTTVDARFVRKVCTRNQFCIRERSPTLNEESFHSDYFSSGSLSGTKSPRKPDTTALPATDSSSSSVNSSALSDSFDLADLLSFDGLNKRVNDRNDIGLEILKAKIHFGADPQDMSTHGERSCLMFAVIANDYHFTKNLVEQGVDVNKRTSLGETALGLAIELKRDEIASYLRSKGAKE